MKIPICFSPKSTYPLIRFNVKSCSEYSEDLNYRYPHICMVKKLPNGLTKPWSELVTKISALQMVNHANSKKFSLLFKCQSINQPNGP